ncbi:alpha/beta fold hydrolase [Sphingosinicella terrae]|uniref:alpha/beta fold hydrolase n=1 Tax=Sphingosinicella terrae TaxID=2172047 RepID=UPI000E0DD468|nr:alpha/beta fold hydrolase [Sphingosinicella terrae]
MLREETAANPARTAAALAGLRRYQEAARDAAPQPMPPIATVRHASLRDYGGEGPPVLFVPSLINPPTVLDLGERSLLRWLAGRGRRVLLLDWGWPDPGRAGLSVAGHVEEILLPLAAALGEPVDLVGYCLGGTMAAAAARPAGARSLVLIASPWRFSAFPEEARTRLAGLWQGARPAVEALGVLPMEALQSAFWSLDPGRTVAKFEAFATMGAEEARMFVALEDWANDGPPLAGAAARELFEDFFAADRPGRGEWRVAGEPVAPSDLTLPTYDIVSTTDRIVPAGTAMGRGDRLALAQGHVGMIVGSRARQALWEPLAGWLSRTAAKW